MEKTKIILQQMVSEIELLRAEVNVLKAAMKKLEQDGRLQGFDVPTIADIERLVSSAHFSQLKLAIRDEI